MTRKHVAIAGGGLAGLTCAKYLVDAGMQVTVLESEPFLGGRASTYRDADGEWVEQGLHVYLGVYSEFNKLLSDIGRPPDDVLFWMDQVHYHDPQGPHATFGTNPIRSPIKTILSAIGQNDYLGILDKASFLPMALPALGRLETIRKKYDGLSVTQWWQRVSGREDVLERILRPVCRAIQFTDPDDFSAYDFLGWVHNSIADIRNARLGGYRGARDESIFAPLGRWLTDRGVTIRTSTPLRGIEYQPQSRSINGLLLDHGERLQADAYVMAVPCWILSPLIPPDLKGDPFFARIAELPVAPAISVQLWFDRFIADGADYHLIARSIAPVYQQQSPRTYPVASGSRLSVIVSPADELLDHDDASLVRMVVESLRSVGREVTEANVTKSVILRHRHHLVRPLPGAMSARPAQRTPLSNLFLAGDWTQQSFFGSQEGAVRGGKACAAEIRASR